MIGLLSVKINKVKRDNLNRLIEISKLYKRLSLHGVFNQTYTTAMVCFVHLIEYTMQIQSFIQFQSFC